MIHSISIGPPRYAFTVMIFRLLPLLVATGAVLHAADAWAVPTFESLGLYYNRSAAAKEPPQVSYRVAGSADWREGHPLVYDSRERQYRGSLVDLKAGHGVRHPARSGRGEDRVRG